MEECCKLSWGCEVAGASYEIVRPELRVGIGEQLGVRPF